MSSVREAVAAFRALAEPLDGTGNSPFRLACTLGEPAREPEVQTAWQGRRMPEDLLELWATCREARLFEDIDYGQWGLHVLSPDESAKWTEQERQARPGDIGPDDVVFAKFLGDQELLVRTPADDDCAILVALPLDSRSDWYCAGPGVAEFLERYLASVGAKFWESL